MDDDNVVFHIFDDVNDDEKNNEILDIEASRYKDNTIIFIIYKVQLMDLS